MKYVLLSYSCSLTDGFCGGIEISLLPVCVIPCIYPPLAEPAHEAGQRGITGAHGGMYQQGHRQHPFPPGRREEDGCQDSDCNQDEGRGCNQREESLICDESVRRYVNDSLAQVCPESYVAGSCKEEGS